jgi:hypothetical protein
VRHQHQCEDHENCGSIRHLYLPLRQIKQRLLRQDQCPR